MQMSKKNMTKHEKHTFHFRPIGDFHLFFYLKFEI